MGRVALVSALCLMAAGCNSIQFAQTNYFANDDGQLVKVNYGRSERAHVGTYIAPSNKRKMEFRSNLAVEVTMPDGDTFTAWQSMNFINNGTMYRTDDGEWTFFANGFTCSIFRMDEDDPQKRSPEVYRGVVCNTPVSPAEKDERWRKVKGRVDKKFTGQ